MTSAIKAFFQRQIAYPPVIAKATGSVKLTIMWQQIHYWSDKTQDPEGWVYKTREHMFEETGLSRKEQETARDLGMKLGVLESKVKGTPPVVHYRVNEDKMAAVIEKYLKEHPEKKKPAAVVVSEARTPKEEAVNFFEKKEAQQNVINYFVSKGADESAITQEIAKFISYWTEKNSTGTKQRWQMEKTFEVRRRLVTWFGKIIERNKSQGKETKGIRI